MCSSLSEVTLLNGLTVIGSFMFYMGYGNTILSSITIPSTISSIGLCYHLILIVRFDDW